MTQPCSVTAAHCLQHLLQRGWGPGPQSSPHPMHTFPEDRCEVHNRASAVKDRLESSRSCGNSLLHDCPCALQSWTSTFSSVSRCPCIFSVVFPELRSTKPLSSLHQSAAWGRSVGLTLTLAFPFQCAPGPGTLGSCFESRVVVVCEKMMSRACWAKSKHLIHSKTFRGMTLLHLAAAQGYATLIQTLIKWR